MGEGAARFENESRRAEIFASIEFRSNISNSWSLSEREREKLHNSNRFSFHGYLKVLEKDPPFLGSATAEMAMGTTRRFLDVYSCQAVKLMRSSIRIIARGILNYEFNPRRIP